MKKRNIKLKHIQSFLQDINEFDYGEKQKWNLQQHKTPANIAAKLLHHIYETQNIEQMIVADLGTGTGVFITGLLFIGASYAIGYQFDQKYANICSQTLQQKLQNPNYDIVITDLSKQQFPESRKMVDLVITNPPFGTKEAGIDIKFLEYAMKICSGKIYSFHKSSTRQFLKKFVEKENYIFELIEQIKFPLPKRFEKYHKKQVSFTLVDIICIYKK